MQLLILVGFVVLAVASRFLPVPPNFSPIMALALFSGVFFSERKLAYLIPISAMLISDLIIGLHPDMLAVYLAFALIVSIGTFIKKVSIMNVLGGSVAGAVLFFVITNFSVWLTSGMYAYNFSGLMMCFEMAIPFFRNTLSSSILYSAVLFGSYSIISRYIPEITFQPQRIDK